MTVVSFSLVEKRQHDQRAGVKAVPVAYILCQTEIALGLIHVVAVEAERRQSIIAGKQELGLAGLERYLQRLIVKAEREVGRIVALVDLGEHGQRHRKVLALVERAVNLDGLFGGRYTLRTAAVRERAAGDRKVSVEPRLEAEIADAGCNFKAAAAGGDGARRIDHRIEHAEVRIAAARHALQGRSLGHCHTALYLVHRLDLLPKPREGNTFGVERLRNRSRSF